MIQNIPTFFCNFILLLFKCRIHLVYNLSNILKLNFFQISIPLHIELHLFFPPFFPSQLRRYCTMDHYWKSKWLIFIFENAFCSLWQQGSEGFFQRNSYPSIKSIWCLVLKDILANSETQTTFYNRNWGNLIMKICMVSKNQ